MQYFVFVITIFLVSSVFAFDSGNYLDFKISNLIYVNKESGSNFINTKQWDANTGIPIANIKESITAVQCDQNINEINKRIFDLQKQRAGWMQLKMDIQGLP